MWRKHFAAIFLDMDGALLDSNGHAEPVWEQWAHQRQIDYALLRPRIYSQRVQEILRQLTPRYSDDAECQRLEQALLAVVRQRRSRLRQDAAAWLAMLGETPWGVVTQAGQPRAAEQIAHSGMCQPPLVIGAEQVSCGRPDPEPYLLAASHYGLDPRDCLVIESDEAGIRAAQAAGMTVIALSCRRPRHSLQCADVVIGGWRSIILHPQPEGIVVEVIA
ncbi:haloacid dehalogenase [Edwardsiella ictaluri]|uniref:HAD-superfamily hydrolase, subfamily IA, variant 3 n=2 Tax=Edwardsiella ictaluri TaxID=67780 RepID=C5B7L3_EDWI9|nr:HAD-IA family hydrolase [Edwardsiella ictaluri]ACR67890.1 HAD-superfamily hydrolase, subfamily IA, variant 3 [Edwardsiella ictaluri 93-146]ARD40336.1 haloacid dehalogenase [Edwardsiella ictaluri]AVZ81676.1 haloacid dehalogenase [Edwardsiella ictaluri]EKS7761981.1 HAD-IA family hydrolase [Edwardsiella ictaluri]EKS7768791.1 HAD-IA family hydrolase [Edwardsiella ictaluri]